MALENTELNEWYYVSFESNIADKTSRHQTFKQLFLEKSWFNRATILLNDGFNIAKENKKLSVNNINITKSNWEYYCILTKLTRHLARKIKLIKNWLNWKRGY